MAHYVDLEVLRFEALRTGLPISRWGWGRPPWSDDEIR